MLKMKLGSFLGPQPWTVGLALAALMLGAVGFWYLSQGSRSDTEATPESLITQGASALEFELMASDGSITSLKHYRDEPVLLFFNMGSG